MTRTPRSRTLLALALCGALGLGACAAPQRAAVGGEVEGAGAQAACKCQAGWSQAPPPAGELTEAAIKESEDKASRP